MDLNDQTKFLPKTRGCRISRLCTDDKLTDLFYPECRTVQDLFAKGVSRDPSNDCLGWFEKDELIYKWITYATVQMRAKFFGDGLIYVGVPPGNTTNVGIFSVNRPRCVIAEQGLQYHSMILVPIYERFGLRDCVHIINNAEIPCLIVDTNRRLEILLSRTECLPHLKNVILFEKPTAEVLNECTDAGISLYTMDEIEHYGKRNSMRSTVPKPTDVALIIYTSGTTGMPKGCVITHDNIIAAVSGVLRYLEANQFSIDNQDILVSYLPLAQVYEREFEYVCLTLGARIGFYQGDSDYLLKDIRELRPTILPTVPRLLNKIYDKILEQLAEGNPLKQLFFNIVLSKKKRLMKRGKISKNTIWDRTILKRAQFSIGGNVRLITTGAAPISNNVLTFLRCIMGCQIIEGYGLTECMGLASMTMFYDVIPGHVGPPAPHCQIKLEDIRDLEIDKIDNIGEICIKSKAIFQCYYKDKEATAKMVDNDGFIHTGDIGKWTEAGTLKIVDRKRNMMKISQGDYVSPEKIETIYTESPLIEQIYVHGDSLQSYIVAIVVPDQVNSHILTMKYGILHVEDFSVVCRNLRVKEAILKEIADKSKEYCLSSLEQVKDIYLHDEPFSVENGMLTPNSHKLRRGEIYRRFQPEIKAMYAKVGQKRLVPDRFEPDD